jgi:type IX secretion system PorP/SprF family membrane protein
MYPLYLQEGKGKLDIGLNGLSDKAGAFNTLDIILAIDYNKEIAPNNNLCLSLTGGFIQKSLSTGGLTFGSQYVLGSYSAVNPSSELILNEKVSHPDVGFGFMWYMNPPKDKSKLNAYLGISGFHLNQPNQSLTGSTGKLPMRFAYIGGVKIFGENKIDLLPNIRVNHQKGNQEIAAGIYLDYNLKENAKLVVGSWFRPNDAVAVLVGFEHKSFTFGYSYDVVISSLNNVATGVNAHEITLAYKLHRQPKGAAPSLGEEGSSVRLSPFASF